MTVAFDCVQVKDHPVSFWQLADQLHQVAFTQLGICLRADGWSVVTAVVHIPEMHFLFLKMPDTGIDHDPPDPSLKSPLKLELGDVLEYFDESILQHILRLHGVVSVPKTYGHHFTRVP